MRLYFEKVASDNTVCSTPSGWNLESMAHVIRLADGPMMPPAGSRSVRRRPVQGALAALVLIAAIVVVVRPQPLLVGFARLFRVDDPAPSDAVLVLTDQVERVGQLYRRRWTREIILVPVGRVPFDDLNENSVLRTLLIRDGIAPDAIRELPPVPVDAGFPAIARRVREDLQRRPIRRLIIAADVTRTARLRRVFRNALRELDVDVRMAATTTPASDETVWYRSDEGLVAYFRAGIDVVRQILTGDSFE